MLDTLRTAVLPQGKALDRVVVNTVDTRIERASVLGTPSGAPGTYPPAPQRWRAIDRAPRPWVLGTRATPGCR